MYHMKDDISPVKSIVQQGLITIMQLLCMVYIIKSMQKEVFSARIQYLSSHISSGGVLIFISIDIYHDCDHLSPAALTFCYI